MFALICGVFRVHLNEYIFARLLVMFFLRALRKNDDNHPPTNEHGHALDWPRPTNKKGVINTSSPPPRVHDSQQSD